MQNKQNKYLQWKLNLDGNPVADGGGQNSAVDAEILTAKALLDADIKWPGNGYKDLAIQLMNSLKPALIDNFYIPFCMYPTGNSVAACDKVMFLGYIDLQQLNKMCSIDSSWCNIYTKNKVIMQNAVTSKGVYSEYNFSDNKYYFYNADIHPNWAIKHLALDGGDSWNKVKPFYDQARSVFMDSRKNGGSLICKQFNPDTGCEIANPDWRVYGNYLEIAKARNDNDFANELISVILEKKKYSSYAPLMAADNFGNIVMLEALSYNSGYITPQPVPTPTGINIKTLPITCGGGKCTLTSDKTSGTCRTIVYNSGADKIQIQGCVKENSYIEVYRQVYPSFNFRVCISTGCVDQNQGFAKFTPVTVTH